MKWAHYKKLRIDPVIQVMVIPNLLRQEIHFRSHELTLRGMANCVHIFTASTCIPAAQNLS
jgi:beta-lactamase class D